MSHNGTRALSVSNQYVHSQRNPTLPPLSRSTLLELCRSGTVASSFDPAKLNGMWYEQAYTDIAQVGASCQTLNSTFVQPPNPSSSNDGNVVMAFKVNYGKIPFTITELYTQNQPPVNGFYTKTAEMPGGKFLKLSTVFVDVSKSDSLLINIYILGELRSTLASRQCIWERRIPPSDGGRAIHALSGCSCGLD